MAEHIPSYRLTSYGVQLESSVGRSIGMYNFQTSHNNRMGSRLTLALTTPVLYRDEFTRWQSFVAKLNVSNFPFYFCPFLERIPQGDILSELTLSPLTNNTFTTLTAGFNNEYIVSHTIGTSSATANITFTATGDKVTLLTFFAKNIIAGSLDKNIVVTSGGTIYGKVVEGWNKIYVRTSGAGPSTYTLSHSVVDEDGGSVYEFGKIKFLVSNFKAYDVNVTENYWNRLNKENAINGSGAFALNSLSYSYANALNDGLHYDVGVTTTGTSPRNIALPIINLVGGSDRINNRLPYYKITYTLITLTGSITSATVGFSDSLSGTPTSGSFFSDTVSPGANTHFLHSPISGSGYLLIQFDDTTSFTAAVLSINITKLSETCELTNYTPVTLGVATNDNFHELSGASTSGFTANQPWSGRQRAASFAATVDSSKKYLISGFIKGLPSGADVVRFSFGTAPSTEDTTPSFAASMNVTPTSGYFSVIVQPDGDDNAIFIYVPSTYRGSFVIKDLQVLQLDDYGTDTIPARSSLGLIVPDVTKPAFVIGDYIGLPNSQLVVNQEGLGGSLVSIKKVNILPILRSNLTTGSEITTICPIGKFVIESSAAEMSNREAAGIYDQLSFIAIEDVTQ